MKLLLLSNSTMKGEPYLSWPIGHLNRFLNNTTEILFIPFAGVTMSYDEYTNSVAKALEETGTNVVGIHTVSNAKDAIRKAECIAVGGGNTFQLLAEMKRQGLVGPIQEAVDSGASYIGWSAGSNVACPTIMTTNDMPIVMPTDFNALGLVNFQINAHFTEKTIDGHGGESRSLRIKELLTLNPEMKVVGLPEGKLIEVDDETCSLKGIESEGTVLFRSNHAPMLLQEGKIDW
jgi:dipeptidase E